jgi:hypothetical protein
MVRKRVGYLLQTIHNNLEILLEVMRNLESDE